MPTVIRFADGQKPVRFDEDYEQIRDRLMENEFKPVELHSQGTPVLVYPQNVVVALPTGDQTGNVTELNVAR
jgi:hypothetical protein